MRGPFLLALALAACLCLLAEGALLPIEPAQAQTGPSFGTETIDDITLLTYDRSFSVTLPEASGGSAPLSYSLTGALPTGLSFNTSSRVLSGYPTATSTAVTYTYTVTDSASPAATASLTFTITVNDGSSSDKAVLEALYDATNGASWTDNQDWKSSKPIGEWAGVTTDVNGRVIYLSYLDSGGRAISNNLNGTLPADLGKLSRLRQLVLAKNSQLTGGIPKELGNLSRLQTLFLNENNLTGGIPKELGNLSQLQHLRLQQNKLTGGIPKELGKPPLLSQLLLNANELTGPIPPELGSLTRLTQLWLHQNELTGPIPPELGNLTMLTQLVLARNQLTGGIPPELGKLTKLTYLWLQGNQLTGGIPPEVANLLTINPTLNFETDDASGPTLSEASVNGTALILTFNEALSTSSAPAKEAFTVRADGFEWELEDIRQGDGTMVSPVSLSRSKVTLTLPHAATPANSVTVSYDKTLANNKLQDVVGNEAESFVNEDADNVTPAGSASITTTNLVSTPSFDTNSDSAPDTYGRGEHFLFKVTYSSDVIWDLSAEGAQLAVQVIVGSNTRTAPLVTGGATSGRARTLVFRYTFVQADVDTNGIALRNDPVYRFVFPTGGATLQDAEGRNAARSIGSFFGDTLSNHKVDGGRSATDDQAPKLIDAMVNGATVKLTFDEDLAPVNEADERELRYAFIVQGGRWGGTLIGNQSPNRVTVSGPTATLFDLGSPFVPGQPVTVSYWKGPGLPWLKDAAGNEVAAFDDVPATNVTPPGDASPPVMKSATVEGNDLRLVFDRGLLEWSVPEARRFWVWRSSGGPTIPAPGTGAVRIRGTTVEVTLEESVAAGESLWVNYLKDDDANPLRGANGDEVADIWSRRVVSLDETAPSALSGAVGGKEVTLYFSEALDETSVPATGDFEANVTPQGDTMATTRAVSVVSVKGAAVFLTLATSTAVGDTVTVAYAKPTAEEANPIRDPAGNETATFSAITLTNEGEADQDKPALTTAKVDGGVLTLTFDQPLDPTKVPDNGAFLVSDPPTSYRIDVVRVQGVEVKLVLGWPVMPCEDGIMVRYVKPRREALRNRWAIQPDDVSKAVANERADDCDSGGATGMSANGPRMTLGFDGALDRRAAPRAAHFTVTPSSGGERTDVLDAAFLTVGSGVELTLSRPLADGERSTVRYRRAAGQVGLWNMEGRQLADFDAEVVAGAPSVAGVAITSDAGDDDTYLLGETIRITLTFNEAVDVDMAGGTPRLKIDMDPAEWGEKWADYDSGSGAATLTFTHTVVQPNYSTQGVAVLEDTLELNGGSIKAASSDTDVGLDHDGLDHDASHKVDWRRSPGQANRAPAVDTEAENYEFFTGQQNIPRGFLFSKSFYQVLTDPDGDELTYSVSVSERHRQLLDDLSIGLDYRTPENSHRPLEVFHRVWFEVDSEEDWKAISPALSDPVLVTATLTARDPEGLSVSLDGSIMVDWESHPEVVKATASEQSIELTFDVAVEDGPATTPGQFTVNVVNGDGTAATVAVTGVSVNGAVVTLGLGSELEYGQTVSLDYAHDDDTPLQRDGGGDSAPGFSGQAVSHDITPSAPTVTGVEITSEPGGDDTYKLGETISVTLTFSEAVTVTGTPRLKIDMDPAHWGEKWATYASGSGTKTLTFTHTVVEPNYSTQGIAVLANSLSLNGGTIQASGVAADLAHTSRNHDPKHKVDWRQ